MANDEATIAAQPLWLARIQITLKPVVLDPQGDAVLRGLHHLGFAEVTSVRAGKYLEVALAAQSEEAAAQAVRQMCEKLLANPVIEGYDFSLEASR
jgi:phosphoribosylformylglycinamidine synthase subunit PurS